METRRVWKYLRPPSGIAVRRFAAFLTLAIGIPRTTFFYDLINRFPLRFGDTQIYGVLFTILGIALLVTAFWRRLAWPGRLVASLAFVVHVAFIADIVSASSLVSSLAEGIIVYALFGEIVSHEG